MKRRIILIIVVNALCLIGTLVCLGVASSIKKPLYAGQGARACAGQRGDRYAQLAVYFPRPYSFNESSVYKTRAALESALLASSLEDSGERRLYADAWSAEGKAFVVGERGSSNATVTGVGGDFFLFHPLYLRDGSYISPNDVMRDRVVLDEELAWRLFGSVHLAGLNVLINGETFVISGVISRESGYAFDKVNESEGGLFMSFEALDAMTSEESAITCYEIAIPDIVTDFGKSSLETALDDESLNVVDNTNRFSYGGLFRVISSFGERSLRPDAVAFPYWENASRFAEDWLALLFVVSLAFLVCPASFAVFYGVRLSRIGFRRAVSAVKAMLKRREERIYARYLQEQGEITESAGR